MIEWSVFIICFFVYEEVNMKLFNTLTNKKKNLFQSEKMKSVFMCVDQLFIIMFILEIQDQ